MSFIINPILWIFVLFLIYLFTKKRNWFILGILTLYFFSSPIILNLVSKKYAEKPIDIVHIETYDYGILLGGIAHFNKEKQFIHFSEESHRLLKTIELFNKGKIKKIFIAAGRADTTDKETIEAIFIKKYMISIGIADSLIICDYKSANTHQNAKYCSQILKPKQNKDKYLLISSSIHLKRANACFKKEGFSNIDNFPTNEFGSTIKLNISQLSPSASTIQKWDYLLHEFIGMLSYKLMRYI